MKRLCLSILLAGFCHMLIAAPVQYNDWFSENTLRLDYFHSGNAQEEHFAIDRITNDGQWAGSSSMLIDELNRGLYMFEVHDKGTGALLYSRGFASVFGEWQTIPQAKTERGTFHETIRFPWPLKPVIVVMKKRDDKNVFQQIWSSEIDPASRRVNKSVLKSDYKVYDKLISGDPLHKVDIVILGDGYTADEMGKFRDDVDRLTNELFNVAPFNQCKDDFNVRAVETPSATSGVCKPHPGVFARSPLSVQYSSFDSERYALTYDNKTVRDVAATVPYDFMFILINEQTYGGGGIYQLYATVAAHNKFSDYIFVHEFGHHFAALADEYYTSAVSYQMPEITVEPWEPNITSDTRNLKWKAMVEPGTPVPTPWNKSAFDQHGMEVQKERTALRAAHVPESEVEALFEREKIALTLMNDDMEYAGKVGAFEGGGYYQYGMYRPQTDCIMYTRNRNDFCKVCQHAIEQVIEYYVK